MVLVVVVLVPVVVIEHPDQPVVVIEQPDQPVVIAGPVVMPLMMELVVIAGQVICISGWWSRW